MRLKACRAGHWLCANDGLLRVAAAAAAAVCVMSPLQSVG